MAIIITKNRLSPEDFQKAKEAYKTYIKLTIDVEKEIAALGGEYHADAEKLLLEQGSKQEDIWGGGFNLETKYVETNAIINLKPGRNDSPEILDPQKRKKILRIAQSILNDYL